jgi:hypothetical protein
MLSALRSGPRFIFPAITIWGDVCADPRFASHSEVQRPNRRASNGEWVTLRLSRSFLMLEKSRASRAHQRVQLHLFGSTRAAPSEESTLSEPFVREHSNQGALFTLALEGPLDSLPFYIMQFKFVAE